MSILGTPVLPRVGAASFGVRDVGRGDGGGAAFGAPSIPCLATATFGTPVHDRAAAAALAAHSNYETDPPPPGGWTTFLNALVLRIEGGIDRLPDGHYVRDKSLFDATRRVWDASHTFVVALEHPPSGARYVISNAVGTPGAFGAAWAFALQTGGSAAAASTLGLPRRLVVKFFMDIESPGTLQEVERLERMKAVDAARLEAMAYRGKGALRRDVSGDEPTPDRVQTRVLYDKLGAPCVVMPCMSGTLPFHESMPVALSMEVIRSVFVDLEDMYKRYQLLSFDLKTANVLLDVRRGRVRVRATDFGGYGDMGAEVRATYPLPWNLKTRIQNVRRPDGRVELYKEMFNALDEEMCVYQLGVLLLELTAGRASSAFIPSNMNYLTHAYLESHINPTTGRLEAPKTVNMWRDVVRSPAWTAEALAFLRYVSRYDETRGGLGAAPGPTTMAGLRAVLMPAVDVIDLTVSDDEMEHL
jgi:hypothetical protein